MNSRADDSLVLSYLGLRKAVGVLGIALPFVLAFGTMLLDGPGLQASISHYYYTGMRNVFVGTLCAIAVFMMSYRYDSEDDIAGDIACVLSVGVALFPTTPSGTPSDMQQLIGRLHLACAAGFFLTLSYFSLVLFTRTNPTKQPTPQKVQRNRVYRVCGWIMLAAIGLIVLYSLVSREATGSLDRLAPVFWLEAIAVVAFGVSWLTKGEAILKDR